MKSIGIFEARKRLSELLDRIARGEKFTITRRGVPTALLVPVTEKTPKLSHREIVEGMLALRTRVKASKVSVRKMINQGRRF
jgi:prevent-host-death family protein